MKTPNYFNPDVHKAIIELDDSSGADLLYHLEGDEWYYIVGYHKWKQGYKCRECGGDQFREGKTPGSRRCTNAKCAKRPDESALANTNLEGIKIPMQQVMDILCEVLLPVKEHFATWSENMSEQEYWAKTGSYSNGETILPENLSRWVDNTLKNGTIKEGDEKYTAVVLRPSYETISKSLETPVNTKTIEGLFNKIMDCFDAEDTGRYQWMIDDILPPNSVPLEEQTDAQKMFINYPNWFKGVKRDNYGRYMKLLFLFMVIPNYDEFEGVHSKQKLALLQNMLDLPNPPQNDRISFNAAFEHMMK